MVVETLPLDGLLLFAPLLVHPNGKNLPAEEILNLLVIDPEHGSAIDNAMHTERDISDMLRLDPAGKLAALTRVIAERRWNVALLSDLRYKEDGHREIMVGNRDAFREQLSLLLDHSSSRLKVVLAGDFNAEVGATHDALWTHVLGPYGDSRRTRGGVELLQFCEDEGLVVANTYTAQTHKGTWFHNRWGTEHALDHFLVKASDRRWVRSTRTIHFSSTDHESPASRLGRPRFFSSASWLEYTDHNPVELMWKIGKDWKAEARSKESELSRPDVLRLLGSSTEAQTLRLQYANAVTSALETVHGQRLDWDAVAMIMKDTALRLLGPCPRREFRPWLRGKERELHELENRVHRLEIQLHQARRDASGSEHSLLSQRRSASRELQKQKRRWEAQWWDELADQANTAGQRNNSFAFWQVCRQLGLRDSGQLVSSGKRTVAHPEVDREAWKHFLSQIQSGPGEVDPSVWDHVPVISEVDDQLASPPSWNEFRQALRSMNPGRRGGMDDITVELIKYGGDELQSTVFSILLDMWASSASADAGAEAAAWPLSVRTGICIPVYKNKGDRKDMHNYRNLVMLSVAAKLVARIVADRLSAWAEPFFAEEQNGFRRHRGTDDAHQTARRIIEEVVVSDHDRRVAVTTL
ncbi:Caroteno-chlorophyll a-c-binding protein [Durusdinium trenchii]|uniref:Caroteno-chlorophyll a-c-binding protein n=1 Tax=Durusdinium trenchii TaxID=1381693 RepID=A0ABP0LT64_9DINO